jgi:dipeptidyl aminopeptidase/acylaminoacyl peptidase
MADPCVSNERGRQTMKRLLCISGAGRTAGLAALLCVALTARGQGFTIEEALSYPYPHGLIAATHGERVAWVFNVRGAENVWVADGPDFAARQLTHYTGDNGMPIASLRLTPDGNNIVYARGSETNDQGRVANPTNSVREPQQEVWVAEVSTGEPHRLGTMNCRFEDCEDIQISPDGRYAVWSGAHELWIAPVSGKEPPRKLAYIRGNSSQPRWSPDSKKIAFVTDRDTHSFIGIYTFGEGTLRYADPSTFHDILPRWSPDSSQLAFIRLTGTPAGRIAGGLLSGPAEPWTIFVWDATSGKAREIWRGSDDTSGTFLREGEWEEDAFQFAAGNRVIFASQEDGWVHIYSISADGGAPVLLTPGNYSFQGVTLTADGKELIYASNENDVDRLHIWRTNLDHPGLVALTRGDSIEWMPVVTGDARYVLCLGSTATQPAMPYRITQHGPQMIAGRALPANYPSAQFVVPRQVVFKSLDGLEIHGQLFVPRDRTRPMPALVFIHGGPFRHMFLGFHPMADYNFMYAANQYLASRGYVVLSVNYRLSILYGRAFREPAHAGPHGASEYQDIVAGAKYLQSLPYVDPQKIGLWGGSYGGYLTAMGLARNSDIFKAGVDYAGVHDWAAREDASASDETRRIAYDSSPVASIDKWKSPVLLIQGDDDRNVPFAQTVNLVRLLRQHHIPYEQIVFPDEVHGSLLWRTWVRFFQATGSFFDRTLVKDETIQPAPPEN